MIEYRVRRHNFRVKLKTITQQIKRTISPTQSVLFVFDIHNKVLMLQREEDPIIAEDIQPMYGIAYSVVLLTDSSFYQQPSNFQGLLHALYLYNKRIIRL